MEQLSLNLDAPAFLPLDAYDRPHDAGDDLNGPLSTSELAALAYHGIVATRRPDGCYDVDGERWPQQAWELRNSIDCFFLMARHESGICHPLREIL